jgi:molybdopterin synthase catalytic subunit/molybdopterin converting factor small subunit
MRIQILPFGVLKDWLSDTSLELPAATTVADLLVLLSERVREQSAARMLSRIAVSVNAEYAQSSQILHDGDLVGLLPPVSGGLDASGPSTPAGSPLRTYLTRAAIEADALITWAKQGSDGAVVVFDGIVRDNTRGRRTLHLDYEAYEEMAERQIAELASQCVDRFGVRSVTLVHRLGRLEIGETSVLIIVASVHRGAAFDACRWLIDTLKKTVPIWKKETFVDGAVWADGEPFPEHLTASGAEDLQEHQS